MKTERIPIVKIKELRGQLLDFLADIYPYDITLTSIYSTYYQYYETSVIDKALQYLEDKEYIKIKIQKGVRFFDDIQKYAITAKGIDLIDGSISDNGIIRG